jgi:hypothetical protein
MYVDAGLLCAGSLSGTTNVITGQSVVGTGNINSTNVVDLLQNRDIGEGAPFFGRFEVGTAVAGGTSVEMQVIAHDDTGQSTNVTVIGTSGAIPVASLTAGARFAVACNPRIANKGQRYLSQRFVVVGTTTGGVIVGDFGLEIQNGMDFFPSGFSVL